MMIIGLTGSFGTGKSYVASVFKELGAKVIDADVLARKALLKNSGTYKKIITAFGKGILDKSGEIDRRVLAGIVFNERRKLKKLNRIVHPEVIRKIKKAIGENTEKRVIIIDAPLLIEADLAKDVDKLIVVTSSKAKQIERCMKKFRISRGEILKRINSQIPLKTKIKKADFVIDNNGAKSRTKEESMKIWRKMGYGDS